MPAKKRKKDFMHVGKNGRKHEWQRNAGQYLPGVFKFRKQLN